MRLKQPQQEQFSTDQAALAGDSRWQLALQIAQSPFLARASQLREILIFVVKKSILEPDAPIQEFEIAHTVLGRRKDFNPLDDNIVRVQMAHLRKKLDMFFSTDGKEEPIILTIALGSYKPVFTPRAKVLEPLRTVTDAALPAETLQTVPSVEIRTEAPANSTLNGREHSLRAYPFTVAATVGCIVLLSISIFLAFRVYEQKQTIDAAQAALSPWRSQPSVAALWTPFFASSHDTDVILGDNSLLLIEQITRQFASVNGYFSRNYLAELQDSKITPNDRFILSLIASKGLGSNSEFKLAQRIMAQDSLNKRLHLYGSRQYVTTLLKQNNVILIGGKASNPWEGLYDDKLTFSEGMKFIGLGVSSVVNRSPKSGELAEYVATDSVGWCVVAYLPNPGENTSVLLLEGTGAEATEAAGDFLLSEDQLSGLLKKFGAKTFPPFEVLLKISQVKGTPLTTSIEAFRTYPAGY
ncbi:MAG: hypothetical protein P4K83_04345 [Terracidiphilus sp.]|nr:hypothetical protein [Terracidiphilus sp.]